MLGKCPTGSDVSVGTWGLRTSVKEEWKEELFRDVSQIQQAGNALMTWFILGEFLCGNPLPCSWACLESLLLDLSCEISQDNCRKCPNTFSSLTLSQPSKQSVILATRIYICGIREKKAIKKLITVLFYTFLHNLKCKVTLNNKASFHFKNSIFIEERQKLEISTI